MRLSELAADLPHRRAGSSGDPEVLAVTHDSRAAKNGTLFAALPGLKSDGRRFVADAVSRGAVAALGLAPAPDATAVPYLEVENPRRSAGLVASLLAGRPSERLVMAGVTGTSGKTTTTYLLDGLLARRDVDARIGVRERHPLAVSLAVAAAHHEGVVDSATSSGATSSRTCFESVCGTGTGYTPVRHAVQNASAGAPVAVVRRSISR